MQVEAPTLDNIQGAQRKTILLIRFVSLSSQRFRGGSVTIKSLIIIFPCILGVRGFLGISAVALL